MSKQKRLPCGDSCHQRDWEIEFSHLPHPLRYVFHSNLPAHPSLSLALNGPAR